MGESPLFKHVARHTIQIIGGLGLGLLVVVLLVGWRLASGPVSISFLTPYIDRALADLHEGAFDVTFDDTILTWAGWERTLDIRIVNLRVKVPEGDVVARVPEVSISLSAQALLNGTVAPRSVEFFGPSLQVSRLADGQVEMGFVGAGDASDSFVTGLIMAMLQQPDPTHAISYLTRVNVVAGEVTFIDHALGTTWQAPRADASIERVDSGLKAELDLDLLTGRETAAVSVLGDYSVAGERIDLGVSFEGVNPASFADLTADAAVLGALDLPLSGTVTLSVEQGGRIEGFGFDVNGHGGHVALPVDVAQSLGALAWAQRVRLEALHLAGRFDGARHALEITDLQAVPGRGETVHLAHPIDHNARIDRLETALSYHADSGELDIQRLHLDMGGPTLDATARLSKLYLGLAGNDTSRGLFADIDVTAENVPFDDLAELWPAGVGDEARNWVLGGLSAGVADHADMQVSLRPDDAGGTRLAALAGKLSADGVDVDYLPPMKRVTGAKARATFNEQRFDIVIEDGTGTGGLKVRDGDIALYDLHSDTPKASIALDITGPVASALTLIDDEPLKFSSDLGIKPADASGDAEAQVRLTFPLSKDMAADDVTASAQATLTNAGLKGVVFGRDLTGATLELNADNDELTVKGEGRLGGVPVNLSWVHDFRDGALFLDRYELSGYIENVLNLDTLGIQVPDVLARYLHGGAEANVSYTEFNDGRQALSAGVDLANIALSAPELGWEKPVGVPGNGTLELRLIHDLPRAIPAFKLTAPDMTVAGSVSFDSHGKLARVDIEQMRTGISDVAGSLTPAGNDVWELVLRGESLDARNLWDEFIGRAGGGEDAAPETPDPEQQKPPLALNVAVDVRTVVMHQGRVIEDLIGTLYRRRGAWAKIDAIGIVGEGAPIEVLLDTDDAGLRYLSITSPNAGSALRRLDLYDNMLGGTLDLKAAYTTPDEDAPLEGVMKINDFAMRNAPVFARLIGIMSLTGVLDALQGEGLNFDIAEVPFKLDGGVLELTQARASGPSLGVTTNGRVDMDNQVLNLKGTVVPAYAINALLGKIPLIGELFTGSEKGGGLFAATYTMQGQGENVDITVNPLSALAPGALRNIFTGSDKAKDIPSPEAPQSTPATPPAN